jgi:GTP-binding protein
MKGKKEVFVDLVRIEVIGGKGGDGCVHFRREKFVPKGGPDGGDGGDGGSIYLLGDRSLKTLLDFKYKRIFKAEKGKPGGGKKMKGRKGRNLIIRVPLGTVIYDDLTGEMIGEVMKDGEKILVARGGRGGRGNARFATPQNRVPKIAEPGEEGERRILRLELKLLADVGILGFPNVGKTTLLVAISGAKGKIAPYPFTTLTPNLGMVKLPDFSSFALVDIPGIIEGAHEGKGMGLAFLRHIERTKILLFLLDATSKSVDLDYEKLKMELKLYNNKLLEKPRIVVINKMDLVENPPSIKIEEGIPVYFVSALKGIGVELLKGGILKCLEEMMRERKEA